MGANTTNGYFYLPTLGASGQAELDLYNAKMQVSDTALANLEGNIVYPQDYATGAGTSGDPWAGACIGDAYTACPTGGTIYLRAGYYELAGDLWLQKRINVIGEGIGTTFIVTSLTDEDGIFVSTDRCILQGFTVDGTSQDNNGGNCINIYECDYTIVRDVEVKEAGTCGINLYRANYTLLQNIYAHDNYEHGIHANGDNTNGENVHNIYRDLFLYDNDTGSGFDDYGDDDYITVPTYNIYNNIQAWGNKLHGIIIWNQTYGTISDCYAFDNDDQGMHIHRLEDFNISNCLIVDNSSGTEEQGLFVSASKNLNFTNVIVKNNFSGIAVTGDTENIKFVNCQSYWDGGGQEQAWAFELTDTNTDLTLINCKVSPNKNGQTIYNAEADVVATVEGTVNGYAAVAGDIQYHNGTNWIRLAKGTAGQVLTMNGGATAPEWATP